MPDVELKTSSVVGLNDEHWVEVVEHCGNRRPRVERLVSAWNQGVRGDAEPEGEADDPLIDARRNQKETSNTAHGRGSGRCANCPRARREHERAGSPAQSALGHDKGEDAVKVKTAGRYGRPRLDATINPDDDPNRVGCGGPAGLWRLSLPGSPAGQARRHRQVRQPR